VDVAALSHHGLDSELGNAFSDGRAVAARVLGASQRPAAPGAGGPGTTAGVSASTFPAATARARPPLGGIAWPPRGVADYGVLGSLAVNGVGTVVLDSAMMPPAVTPPFTPTGVTTTTTGVGTRLHVLLTDDGLDQILASAPTAARTAGQVAGSPQRVAAAAAAFSAGQRFLAETAMIVAESPATPRAVIVAPPRRWNPAPQVVQDLLSETVNTPWLQPVSLAALARGKPGPGAVPRRQPPQSVSAGELRPSLLRQIRKLDARIRLQAATLTQPPAHYLDAAVAAVESSAWRGSRAGHRYASALLSRIQAYLADQERQVTIVDQSRVTLGGQSGSVPVSIGNHLPQSVTVVVRVSAPSKGRIVIGEIPNPVTVPGRTQKTIKIPVKSAVVGATTLTIQLYSRNGKPLPGESATLTVTATHFSTLAVVIIGIAFAVFVITSIGRAVRRGSRPGGDGAPVPEASGDSGAGPLAAPDSAGHQDGPDTVGAERAEDRYVPEEADEHASARGRAEPR
jgi:hypothetical protein